MGTNAIKPIMSMTKAMAAVAEAVTFLNVVASLATPVTSLAVMCAPCMNGVVADGSSSFASLSSGEVGGGVVIAINAMMDAGNSIGSSELVRALIHCKAFSLEGFFESSNVTGNLDRLGVVGLEVLYLALKGDIIFCNKGPVYKVSILSALLKEQLILGRNGRVVVAYRMGVEGTGVDSTAMAVGG